MRRLLASVADFCTLNKYEEMRDACFLKNILTLCPALLKQIAVDECQVQVNFVGRECIRAGNILVNATGPFCAADMGPYHNARVTTEVLLRAIWGRIVF